MRDVTLGSGDNHQESSTGIKLGSVARSSFENGARALSGVSFAQQSVRYQISSQEILHLELISRSKTLYCHSLQAISQHFNEEEIETCDKCLPVQLSREKDSKALSRIMPLIHSSFLVSSC